MYKISNDKLAYKPHEIDDSDTVTDIPSGIYELVPISLFGSDFYFKKYVLNETYIEPIGNESYIKIKNLVDKTFNPNLNTLYKDLGYINKTGIIIYGKPGTGKTAQVMCMAEKICAKHNAICLIISGEFSFNMVSEAIKYIQKVNPNRPVLWVIDEMETIIKDSPAITQSTLVHILDGYLSKNNTCFIGITNYYDKISDKLKDRPSRIKLAEEITHVPYEVIKSLINAKVPKKYIHLIDVHELAYRFSEEKKTIDMVKQEILLKLEDLVLEESIKEPVQQIIE